MNQTIHNLLTEQLASWETARNNYAALSEVQVKELNVNGTLYKVQFNPARIVSSGAKVDAKSIKERKCFLCPANLLCLVTAKHQQVGDAEELQVEEHVLRLLAGEAAAKDVRHHGDVVLVLDGSSYGYGAGAAA